jgi:hypothetical protein
VHSPAAPEERGSPRIVFLDLAKLRAAQEPLPSATPTGALPAADAPAP